MLAAIAQFSIAQNETSQGSADILIPYKIIKMASTTIVLQAANSGLAVRRFQSNRPRFDCPPADRSPFIFGSTSAGQNSGVKAAKR
jgi:hypothetical protein